MQPIAQRVHIAARAALFCLALFAMNSCAGLAPAEVKQQSGYYYGTGSGATKADAAAEAKRDLISNALTETARSRGSRKGRIRVEVEAAEAFRLPRLQPVAKEKAGGQETVMVSIKAAEWEKYERARETALRTELQEKLAALQAGRGRPLASRMLEAGGLLDRLAREGLTDLLTEKEQESLLMSAAVEAFCREVSAGISITTSPGSGFISGATSFAAFVRDGEGAPAGSLPLRVEWTATDAEPSSLTAASGADGRLLLAYPAGESFRDTGVRLLVRTDFSRLAPSAALRDIDAASRLEVSFRHFDDVGSFFSGEVLIPGGPFTAGAVARDKRAARKEAPRQANTTDYYIDLHPVTNALYGMYLEDTRAGTFPEYWDNPRFNQPDQPVIGVTYQEAVRFASWLSAQLGVVKRLPTEDEWEKAARGGQDVIYPWGDQSPTDGARANYNGNGRFSSPSPVGSFEAGKNACGLFDMAGNVWQWTSSYKPGTGSLIVKGGSWMDGPAELRISNRREVDPAKGYVDVGFRLVREVMNEKE